MVWNFGNGSAKILKLLLSSFIKNWYGSPCGSAYVKWIRILVDEWTKSRMYMLALAIFVHGLINCAKCRITQKIVHAGCDAHTPRTRLTKNSQKGNVHQYLNEHIRRAPTSDNNWTHTELSELHTFGGIRPRQWKIAVIALELENKSRCGNWHWNILWKYGNAKKK